MNTQQVLRAAILIISETASRDPSTDKCIDALRSVFDDEGNGQWEIADTKIVPDSILDIQRVVTQWTDVEDGKMNLILSSGGTGFAVKDVTPEAITPLLHKQAPGLVHGMLSSSLSVTPFAVMARPVAGIRYNTLIITLPGSPKGAKENLQALLRLLPHACTQAVGADSRMLHQGGLKKLEKDAGVGEGARENGSGSDTRSNNHHTHSHSHHHGSHQHARGPHTTPSSANTPQPNDPSLGPSRRHRQSPYAMLSVSSALTSILENTPAPLPQSFAATPSIIGHVLAADVVAAESVPAFRASIVDGYAIKLSKGSETNGKGVFPVAFSSHAQLAGEEERVLRDEEIARITTGAPVPTGADLVIMVEDTVLVSKTVDGAEEAEIEILTDAAKRGENIREIGSDVEAGEIVMRKGEGISTMGGEFGLLVSVGTKSVEVYRKPVVGVLSTGDEIVDAQREESLRMGEVRDTNRPTLLAAVKAQGFEAVDLGIASDKPTTLDSALRNALTQVDVLITTGGVSMGELDLLKPTLSRSLGATIHFGRVSMKPGKPTTFATVPSENIKDPSTGERTPSADAWDQKLVFSLPGNPSSALVTFHLFVLPALHRLAGIEPPGLPRVTVRLAEEVRADKTREEYHRVVVFAKGKQGGGDNAWEDGLWATSTGGQRSSRIGSFRGANGLLVVPPGAGMVAKGSRMEVLLMDLPKGTGLGGIGAV